MCPPPPATASEESLQLSLRVTPRASEIECPTTDEQPDLYRDLLTPADDSFTEEEELSGDDAAAQRAGKGRRWSFVKSLSFFEKEATKQVTISSLSRSVVAKQKTKTGKS